MDCHLSRTRIETFLGNVMCLKLVSDEDIRQADIKWHSDSDAVRIREFSGKGEFDFSDGVLLSTDKLGEACVTADLDGVSYTYKGSAQAPYTVTVQAALDPSARGDVNGDGRISNLDALMLLQAINDLLNLDAEQFARADLNGDGVLTAAEALRILQYVNGTVGDLIMP